MAQPHLPFVPQLKNTMSHASPDKAAAIRSAVTGALKRDRDVGLLCFEHTVETTFVLPWDLNPRVQPQKIAVAVRDGIRSELMDEASLHHLEECGGINWNSSVLWEGREVMVSPRLSPSPVATGQGEWKPLDSSLSAKLEEGYHGEPSQLTFQVSFTTFQVDYETSKLFNVSTNTLAEIRRVAFAPLMPLKTEADHRSLFHAASLGLWGVHDRTSLLSEAVEHTLSDPKAQFLIYERWSEEVARSAPAGSRPEFPQWEAAKKNLASPQLHIFTLANIVQRPIIVYAHPDSPVSGIYLPLLWKTFGKFLSETQPHLKNPLALGYVATQGHFTPLVTFKGPKGPTPILLPITHPNGQMFKVHFLTKEQSKEDITVILSKLMLVDFVMAPGANKPLSPSLPSAPTLAAISTASELPEVMGDLVKRYQSLFL